jgi:hypothetical protein
MAALKKEVLAALAEEAMMAAQEGFIRVILLV